jgi:hypothetical protein
MDLNHIRRLKKLVLAPDFNVQSDALETMRVSHTLCHNVFQYRNYLYRALGMISTIPLRPG